MLGNADDHSLSGLVSSTRDALGRYWRRSALLTFVQRLPGNEVEGTVPHLISRIAGVIGCADFELENENDWSHDHDGIDPTSDSRDDELHQNEPAEPIQGLLKGGDLDEPGVALRQFGVEFGVLLNVAEDGRRPRREESIDRT